MKRRFLFLSLCITISSTHLFAQTKHLEDLGAFVSAMQEIHPDLFFKCDEASFHRAYDSIRNTISATDLSPIDLYRKAQPLTTMLGDGHTQLYFPTEELKAKNALVFPILVEVNTNDSTLYVAREFREGDTVLEKGTQISSINGKDYKQLIAEMLTYCSGERIFFRLSKVNRDFTHFLYMLHPDRQFTVKYLVNNLPDEMVADALPYNRYETLVTSNTPQKEPYQYEVLDNEIALMTFNAFSDLNRFKTFAKSMFTELKEKEIRNLIIDMRMNGGGDSNIGDELFQYISPVPFQQFGRYITRYSDLQKRLAKENFGNDYYSHPNGIDSIKTDTCMSLRDNPLRFQGKVYVLISHTTFSSAGAFSWGVKKFNIGTLVGEESGGMNVCFGDIVIYRLPHSHIASTISFARVYEYGADDKNIHGTMPDVIIPQEKALEQVLQMIKKQE